MMEGYLEAVEAAADAILIAKGQIDRAMGDMGAMYDVCPAQQGDCYQAIKRARKSIKKTNKALLACLMGRGRPGVRANLLYEETHLNRAKKSLSETHRKLLEAFEAETSK